MSEPDAPLSCPACGRATKQHRAGTSLSGIARHLSVSHQSVINWISAAAANIPPPPMPAARQGEPAGGAGRGSRQGEPAVEVLELGELYTFVAQKKSKPTS